MINEVELYVDTINDFPYDDYVMMCQKEKKEPAPDKSKEFKNWNKNMKSIVYRIFLIKLMQSTIADNIVEIKSKNGTQQESLRTFLTDIFSNNNKFRFVREIQPDKLSLLVIDENKKRTTYKMTFIDKNISYENIF